MGIVQRALYRKCKQSIKNMVRLSKITNFFFILLHKIKKIKKNDHVIESKRLFKCGIENGIEKSK